MKLHRFQSKCLKLPSVKRDSVLGVLLLCLCSTLTTFAAPTATVGASPALSGDDALPEIEARVYTVEVVKSSKSKRVYILNNLPTSTPLSELKERKILLLRQDKEAAMAFRVLRVYSDKNQLAVRKVKEYPGRDQLKIGAQFSAIEKIQDIFSAFPGLMNPEDSAPLSEDDKTDLKELEAAPSTQDILAFDPELDANVIPNPDDDEPSEDTPEEGYIDEVDLFDPERHTFTAFELAFLRNTPPGTSTYYTGFGSRYAYAFLRSHMPRKGATQYSLAAEGGIFYYKIVNLSSSGDEYVILPLSGTLRLTFNFSPSFAAFFYGGLLQNNVLSAKDAKTNTQNSLNSIIPAFGTGFIFKLGPGWDLRTDVGYDMIGMGLALRF